jgi:hypothetical protein
VTKRVLDYDTFSGITTSVDYDYATDQTHVIREASGADIEARLDLNKSIANDDDITKNGIKDGWWHYAEIPNIVIEKWIAEYGINLYDKNHEKAVYRLLNQPEWRYLKTTSKYHMPR